MRRLVLLFLLVLSMALPLQQAAAHELLPKALTDYAAQHPDATAAQLQAFIEANPDLSSGDKARQEKLVELAKQGPQGLLANCWQFLLLGIGHILSGPDHILFVFSILLTFVSFRKTSWLLSCFTLSHSITLILAGSNILRVSSLLVEPLIALSIAYVAVTSIFLAPRWPFFADNRAKALTVLCFGFFHGMGFAGALQDVAVPTERIPFLATLLSFNVGVDVGQLTIVLISLPVILLVRRTRWYGQWQKGMAIVISVLAMFWFVQRVVYPA